MTTEETFLSDFFIHNPGELSKEALMTEFTARQELLDEIMEIIAQNQPGEAQQHLLIIGPRGMGKTTLLWAISYTLEDHTELGKEWLPILFSEENYGIGDLADFWLESIRHLEEILGSFQDSAAELLEENLEDLAQQAQDRFFYILDQQGKRALLLLDNVNEIFSAIVNEQEAHQLRATLTSESRVMLVGTSSSYFSQTTHPDHPFYDAFRYFHLERFRQKEMDQVLRTLADYRKDQKVLDILEHEPERVHALRILTGGNPRLTKMVYRLLREGGPEGIKQDLQRLLDECTPYFKHRIESLNPTMRRVFDAIARQWDPTTVGELTGRLRKPSNYVSTQIRRLVEEGFIEEVGGTEKKKTYQVAERFYNIYYLMRYSRTGRSRLGWLVGFMRVFYTLEDYRKWSRKMEKEARQFKGTSKCEERLAFLSTMASATENVGMRQEILDQTVRVSLDTIGLKSLSRLLDRSLQKEMGANFNILDFMSQLSIEQQKSIGYEPNNSRWWYNITYPLREKGYYTLAEQAYRKAIELNSKYATPWNDLGNVLQYHFSRYGESEQAYRKAIELDSKYSSPWNGLGTLLQVHLSRYEESEQAYRKAIELDSKYSYPWNGLGNLLQSHLSRYEESEQAYHKAIELDSKLAVPWNGLGNLLQSHLSRYEESEQAYHKAIELDSKFAFPWNNLGDLLQDYFSRYEESEQAYRKAIELDSEFYFPYSGLAEVLQRLGRNQQESISLSIQGVSLEPEYGFGRKIFLEFCAEIPEPWIEVLPSVLQFLHSKKGEEEKKVHQFALDGLMKLVGFGKGELVKNVIEESKTRELFEPLLTALDVQKDPELLHKMAPERRELVVEVMAALR